MSDRTSATRTVLGALAEVTARSDLLSRATFPFLRQFHRRRARVESQRIGRLLARVAPELVVRSGPFVGLEYPRAKAAGSVFAAKILGSYESELRPVWREVAADPPDVFVDIGCAEGYDAVGLALTIPALQVRAFDTCPLARELCAEMAVANNVTTRVSIAEHCSSADLLALPVAEKMLVMCDCEGSERWIFTEGVVAYLAGHMLIIETHDFVHAGTTDLLAERFRATHAVERIAATVDAEKPKTVDLPELEGLSHREQVSLLAERRPDGMGWLVCRPHPGAGPR